MKLRQYIAGFAALAALTVGFSACQDDIDAPAMEVPVAKSTPNTTIAELKARYWQETDNYAMTIGDPEKPEERTVIHGRVVSSDEASNVFKNLVIQDETGALAFSINSYNLYLNYRVGQEIVMDVTGMYIGKYSGLMQMGMPDWYDRGNCWQISFMAPEYFSSHAELNGVPEPAEIDTIQVPSIGMIGTTPEAQRQYQSQLVCLQNVSFQEGGQALFSSYHSSGENRVITDINGTTMNVRTSGYSTFWNTTLPEGNIDLTGILSFFNNAWQFILIDGNAWTKAPERPGAKDNPYSVDQAVQSEINGLTAQGWVKGYIVGAVAPGVEEVTSADDIEWEAPTVLGNTLVIGQTPETKELEHALVVYLTSESAFEKYGNLRDNPGNLGKEILVQGTLAKYLGTYGITDNNGSSSTFEIEGVEVGGGEIADGTGAKESPYNVGQVIKMNPSSTTAATETGVWTKGYIVGFIPEVSGSTVLSNAVFTADAAVQTNIVLGPTADCTDVTKCIGIQLPKGSIREALNLQTNAGNLGKELAVLGDIYKYCGGPGIKNTSEYVLGEGGDTPTPPATSTVFESLLETDTELAAGWTIDNINSGGLENVWAWKTYNNAGYLNGSGFANGSAIATEAYAISPVIDLTATTSPVASFQHAAKFQTTLRTLCGLYARLEGATAWTKLTIPTWPEAGAWTFANSGNVDLSAYAGKKIQLAFKYGSSADGADTWEIKNLKVIGNGTPDQGGETPTPPVGGGDGEGTAASPYNSEKALEVAKGLAADTPTANDVYVKGKVTSIKELSTQFGNATYTITSEGTTVSFDIFRGYYLNGDKFTSEDQLKVGDEVVVCGKLVNYKGNTPQMNQGNKLISINPGEGGGDEPTPPTPPVTGDGVSVTGNDIAGCVSAAVTVDGYTFTASKESGTTAPAANVFNDVTTIRLYADNTFTISGAAMAKIVFTLNTSTGSRRYTTFTPNTGAVTEQKADDTAITWSGNATSVTFTVGHDATLGSDGAAKRGQVHVSSIEIYPAN